MNFENYYKLQAQNKQPLYSGVRYQKGFGFGDVFQKFFKWITPIVKETFVPFAKKTGKKALKTVIDIASDTLEGKDIKSSSKERIKNSIVDLMSGQGYKRLLKKKKKSNQNKKRQKKKTKSNAKKRQLDIFDYNIISKKHKQ